MTLLQVSAPHFCAGIEFTNDVATLAAPILRWAIGKKRDEFERYRTRKGWKAEPVRKMITHLMIDIETLGTRPGAIVTSVALVRFSDEAHCSFNLSIPDQQALGLETDPATEAWWATQDPVARQMALANPLPLASTLPYLATWIQWAAGGQEWQIWCHGATFDCPLLQEVFRRHGTPCPWAFWQVRDTRTLYDLALINPKDYAVPPPHVALNDAIGQTRAANAALAILARAHRQPTNDQILDAAVTSGIVTRGPVLAVAPGTVITG